MKRLCIGAAAGFAVLTVIFTLIYRISGPGWTESCAITSGTFTYHFWMRLAVGIITDKIMHNRADCSKRRYQQRGWEPKLYKILRVKRWKQYVPTFAPEYFSPQLHTWDEIAQAMCQSEIVHIICAVLSFVPLLGAIPFGALPVFLLTSIAAALLDAAFVAVQRYNHPRILHLADLQNKKGN